MRVKKVEYVSGYKLKLFFSDKKTKIVDIEPIIMKSKGLFHPLKELEYFKKVSLDDAQYPLSICWPNGADICPDLLYEMGEDIMKEQKPSIPPKKKIGVKSRNKTRIASAMKRMLPKSAKSS